jgi:carboxymethylenebutenolidase
MSAVIAAGKISEFSAAAPFYGIALEEVVQPVAVKIPLQGYFAMKDDWITPATVNNFEAGLKASGKTYKIFRYDADHGLSMSSAPPPTIGKPLR